MALKSTPYSLIVSSNALSLPVYSMEPNLLAPPPGTGERAAKAAERGDYLIERETGDAGQHFSTSHCGEFRHCPCQSAPRTRDLLFKERSRRSSATL